MFTVNAGKLDTDESCGVEKNFKYIEEFATLSEAMDALEQVKDYPFAYITYDYYGKEVYLDITPL